MDQERNTGRGGVASPNRPKERPRRSRQEAPERRRTEGADRKRERKPRAAAAPARRPRRQTKQPERPRRSIRRPEPLPEEIPEVVYTPPRPFQFTRFAVELVTMAAVVLALAFGTSLFFRTQVVTVSGNEKYTPYTVLQASGIQVGDSLFPLNEARISGRIIAALPYVRDVRVGVQLPDTVMIQIEELPVTYAVESRDGTWWLMSAEGKLVEQITVQQAQDYTRLKGVQITLPVVGEQAVAAEAAQTVIAEQTVVVATTGAQRLEIAEDILQNLEKTGFLGNMALVDVTDASNLSVWTEGERFRLLLGDKSRLEYKLGCAGSAIGQLAAYESGTLDVSMTGGEKVIFTPVK